MFGDFSKDLLRTGIIEAKAGNRQTARRYLDRALYAAGDHDVIAEAWYWMSQVVDDTVEQRHALENCLLHSMHHAPARRALALLTGELKSEDIVNPDRLSPPEERSSPADAERYMCPKCGGRMAFSPDGRALVCEYCTRRQPLGFDNDAAAEKDFVLTLATARGHRRPFAEHVFRCQGCGSEFILPPQLISVTCAYCGSPHVLRLESSRELLSPDAILPHAFNRDRAVRHLIDWVEGNRLHPEKQVDQPRGIYLPLWTFDVGGGIDYSGETIEVDQSFTSLQETRIRQISDQYPIFVDDLPIPASRKPSAPFIKLLPTFEISEASPYDPRYLADWPAEVYDVPLADASLDARSQSYARYKDLLPSILSPVKLTRVSSASIVVQSFKLVLLPVWMTEIPLDGRDRLVLINGRTGQVEGDLAQPPRTGTKSGMLTWLKDLLDE